MREVVACAVLVGCGFSGPAANAPVGSDAPPGTMVDAPMLVMHDSPPGADAAVGIDAAVTADAPMPVTYKDCLAAYQAGSHSDGPQIIDPDGAGGAAPFTAWCNMTQSGGGWTLAYAYGFTNPLAFSDGSNAVTPRPSWTLTNATTSVPVSTTPPSSPSDRNAIAFPQWSALGTDFLVASNINNTIACVEGSGGIASYRTGTVTCTVVSNIFTTCTTTAPAHVTIEPYGPLLHVTTDAFSSYYYFEGGAAGSSDWPTHDPCGSNTAYVNDEIATASGAIYLRRH